MQVDWSKCVSMWFLCNYTAFHLLCNNTHQQSTILPRDSGKIIIQFREKYVSVYLQIWYIALSTWQLNKQRSALHSRFVHDFIMIDGWRKAYWQLGLGEIMRFEFVCQGPLLRIQYIHYARETVFNVGIGLTQGYHLTLSALCPVLQNSEDQRFLLNGTVIYHNNFVVPQQLCCGNTCELSNTFVTWKIRIVNTLTIGLLATSIPDWDQYSNTYV